MKSKIKLHGKHFASEKEYSSVNFSDCSIWNN